MKESHLKRWKPKPKFYAYGFGSLRLRSSRDGLVAQLFDQYISVLRLLQP
jgi:hypothetical protein